MAVFSNTELNATIEEKWDMKVDEGRYAGSVMFPRVANKSSDIQRGDILHMTYEGRYTVGDVTQATGAFTPQSMTPTSVPITVNQWRQVAIEAVELAQIQSYWDPDSVFPDRAGKALGEDYDTALLNLYTTFTTNVVNTDQDNPTTFDDNVLLNSVLKLRDLNIPIEDISFVLPPIAFYKGIATKPEFRDADKTGLDKSVLTTGYRIKYLGVPAYETTLCPTAGQSRVGLLLHKSALAIAIQAKNNIKRADGTAAGKLSMIAVMHSVYGVAGFRENHGVRINITKS